MHTVFSTVDVPRDEALDYWMDVISIVFPGRKSKVEAFDRHNFYAEIKAGALGDIAVASWRTAPGIARCEGTDELVLMLPSSRTHIEFGDRSFEINRNNLYLIDVREPYVARSLEPVERTIVRLRREALERHISIANAVNRPLQLQGDTALLTAFVRDLISVSVISINKTADGAKAVKCATVLIATDSVDHMLT